MKLMIFLTYLPLFFYNQTACKHTRVPVPIPDRHVLGGKGITQGTNAGTGTGRNQAKHVFNKGPIPL
jgi:hypothetical protein